MRVICPYCHRDASLVTGAAIYKNRPDLASRFFWLCHPCNAYVGTHERNKRYGYDGTEPLGRLANAELRRAKQAAHAAFDPLWRSGQMTRKQAYVWLAKSLGIADQNCHIGMMDVEGCRAVVQAIRNIGEKTA